MNRNFHSLSHLVRLLVAAFFSFALFAQDAAHADDLTATLVASKVTLNEDGKEALVPADEATPGDLVEYAATYKNGGEKPILNLKPLLPIPDGTEYVAASAKPAPTDASLDGEKFEPIPLRREVKQPDGSVREEEVPASEYRALRWSVGELKTGAETKIVARVRLLGNVPAVTVPPASE